MTHKEAHSTNQEFFSYALAVVSGVVSSRVPRTMEYQLENLMKALIQPTWQFMSRIIRYYVDYEVIEDTPSFDPKTSEEFWEMFSNEEYPKNIVKLPLLFHNSTEDISLKFIGDGTVNGCLGIEIKSTALSKALEPEFRLEGLGRLFRDIAPYMLLSRYSTYMVSDCKSTLYVDIPFKDGATWKSTDDMNVVLEGKPLKYHLFDHSKPRSKTNGDISFQTLIALQIYDTHRSIVEPLQVSDVECDDGSFPYIPLDSYDDRNTHNKKASELLALGFKEKVLETSLERAEAISRKRIFNYLSHREDKYWLGNISSRTRKAKSSQEGATNPISESWRSKHNEKREETELPNKVIIKPEKYELLSDYSFYSSVKFKIPMNEYLEKIDLSSCGRDSTPGNFVFVKVFDSLQLSYLYEECQISTTSDE